jgi:hypothetical protein
MSYIQGSPSRPGPEADLVQEFVRIALPNPEDGECRTIFIEPMLRTTRPDIVVVDWDPAASRWWPRERQFLEEIDLRLTQLLFVKGALSEGELRVYFPRQLKASLMRLERAELVNRVNGSWTLGHLRNIFAVHRIITFEAKISALSRGLEQAHLNTWFASESYVLTAIKQPRDQIIKEAQLHGIGLWLLRDELSSTPLIPAKQHPLPQSFASWLFNELAWKINLETS